jgi:hypothetical protein
MAGSPPGPRIERGPFGYQGFFLLLTLIVMVVIVLMSKNLTNSILIIGLIANFLIISSQLTLMGDRHVDDMTGRPAKGQQADRLSSALGDSVMVNPGPWAVMAAAGPGTGFTPHPGRTRFAPRPECFFDPLRRAEGFTGGRKEGFLPVATTAPPGAAAPVFPSVPPPAYGLVYPGSIEFDDLETAPALGYTDRQASTAANAPVGNPFQDDRIADPQAAPACIDDDALAYYDADEQNAYQVRSRNVPERVWAGVYRRKALISRYLNEELDEAEGSRWWGVGDY